MQYIILISFDGIFLFLQAVKKADIIMLSLPSDSFFQCLSVSSGHIAVKPWAAAAVSKTPAPAALAAFLIMLITNLFPVLLLLYI